MGNPSSTFCFRPWTEIYSHFNTCGPCCINYNLYKGNIQTYVNSQELKNIKKEFLSGGKPVSCNECWETEKAGVKSVRQRETTRSKTIQRLSISLSNKCNYKCRMCNPEDSSAWSNDTAACSVRGMSPVLKTKNLTNIDWIIERCKEQKIILTVLGGEPLICDEYIYLLEQIEKYNLYDSITLVITTNLSVLKYRGVDHLTEWAKFTNIIVYASFDGVGSVGEYIRQGYVHDKFCKNLNLSKKFITYLSTTIQLYNVFDIPNIFNFANEYNLPIDFNFLIDPDYLRLENLNKIDRQAVLEHYAMHNFYNEEIFNTLNSDNFLPLKNKFIDYTNSLDILWSKSYIDYIPKLERVLYS